MPESTKKHSKEILHEIIFEADTPLGKAFDVALLVIILSSIIVVMLETVEGIGAEYRRLFYNLEWIFTIFFTIEYLTRLYCVYKPIKYAKSFFGVVDLLAVLPTYLEFFVAGTHSLIVIRALRLMRVFRIFKMLNFLSEGTVLVRALQSSRTKISVFIFFIIILVCICGSLMYVIEGQVNESFDSIPRSVYWAVVTLTTVGYGDISPATEFGQFIAACVMLLGYAIIAVPTGIVSAEMMRTLSIPQTTQVCRYCSKEGHAVDAEYCKYCGEKLNIDEPYKSLD